MKITSVFSAKRDYRKSYPDRLVSIVNTSVSTKTIDPFSSTLLERRQMLANPILKIT